MYDDPPADDDGFNDSFDVTFANMIDALDAYRSNCTDDRCDSENGANAQNHHDFHLGFKCIAASSSVVNQLGTIYSSQGLIPGGEEPFSSVENCWP